MGGAGAATDWIGTKEKTVMPLSIWVVVGESESREEKVEREKERNRNREMPDA